MTEPLSHSYIYRGEISHRRFHPKKHSFTYKLYMLCLDVDDMEKQQCPKGIFGFSWFNLLRFQEKDYLRGKPGSLKQRIKETISELSASEKSAANITRISMLVQVRCLGLYFSPANFYFCYDANNNCTQVLVEVSNTPWNERHYYLVPMETVATETYNNDKKLLAHITNKNFQVSPFMDLNMHYRWLFKPPVNDSDKLFIRIENHRHDDKKTGSQQKLFDASMNLKKIPFTSKALWQVWCNLPAMTLKIVLGIYWQALKLFVKRIPFIGYQKAS